MADLKGKVALVTGASKGIGAGIARALAAAGAAVAVNYASSQDDAEKVVEAIRSAGGLAIPVQGDVSKEQDVKRLFAETRAAFGRVDILVNNAGIYRFHTLEEITEAEYRRQFDTNVLGLLLATQEAVKGFGEEGGNVINIASNAPELALPTATVYTATKAAVVSITQVLAKELGPRGIRVNTISPGGVETEGTHAAGVIGSDFEKELVGRTPLGRLGQPGDIGPAAVFLASPESGWVTGENLIVSGGLR